MFNQKLNSMYYKLEISETGRNSLKEKPSLFNRFAKNFLTKKDVEKFLIEQYWKLPKGKNKIYIDTKEGTKEIGFLHSFWNQDISHNSKKWFQTDWVVISEINEQPILLPELM